MRKKLLISSALSFRSSTPKLINHLSCEVCDSVGSSNVRWRRGWSYAAAAASAPSEIPDDRKSRNRVPKHERRAMVESFVNKYRSENAGKFPKITDIKKQVGGGFYVLREIVQELEYKSKMKSSNSMDETINTGYEHHLEEKRGQQTFSWEGSMSNEVEIISTPSNITSESNYLERNFEEPYPSSLQMPNGDKTEEAVSSYSDSVAPESQLLQEEIEHVSTSFSEHHDTVYGKTQGHESEFVDMENHQKTEEKCIEKAGYEIREQPTLEDLSGQASHSSPQVRIDVNTVEAVSSCPPDYVAPERHLLKEEIEQASAPFIEKPGSSCSKSQSHDSKFVDIENHPTIEKKSFEKARYEGKAQDALEDLPGVDSPKHKMEQYQESSEMDESKIDSSKNKETNVAVVSRKSTLWGNLKSFADGIINIWRKL